MFHFIVHIFVSVFPSCLPFGSLLIVSSLSCAYIPMYLPCSLSVLFSVTVCALVFLLLCVSSVSVFCLFLYLVNKPCCDPSVTSIIHLLLLLLQVLCKQFFFTFESVFVQ